MAIDVREGVGIAFDSLRQNKLRSFLTVLGVIIGITAIMAMISIIEGLNQSMKAQLASLGTDVLYIRPFAPGAWVGEMPDSLRRRKWFKPEDAEAIRRNAPAVLAVAPLNFTELRLRSGETQTRPTIVIGTSPDYMVTNNYAVDNGRAFTEAEVEHRSAVCILGVDHVETLFAKHVARIPTPALNRAIAELKEARPGPSGQRGRRLKLLYATQTATRPPRLRVFVNDPRLVTRDYGYWVENELRARFELQGVPVSIDFYRSE